MTIIVRAPVRISFGGGGTDLAAYYVPFGGFVVSTAINRHCYVVAGDSGDGTTRLNSADYRIWQTFSAGELPEVEEPLILPRAVIEWFWEYGLAGRGVDLFLSSEVPPGTGLGSSSAMTVALICALSTYLGLPMSQHDIADLACRLEIDRLGMPIGKQDQYASACGGLNTIEFEESGVEVRALGLSPASLHALSQRLLLFSTGRSRHSATILTQQRDDTGAQGSVLEPLHALKGLAREMGTTLLQGDYDGFGYLLDHGWQLKRRLSGKVSSPDIDRCYLAARDAGALGGKITGAGGGGFLLLYCPPQHQEQLRVAMAEQGLPEMTFDFDTEGAQVLTEGSREESWRTSVSNIVSEHVLTHRRMRRSAPAASQGRRS